MKINWDKLYDKKCPTLYCKTGREKTKLIKHEDGTLECPRCKGQWLLVAYAPMDIVWTQIKNPYNPASPPDGINAAFN